ncbi:MAG: carboxypeptidase-like regulatory domain-containing protein [Dehalococcoidia bacterium]
MSTKLLTLALGLSVLTGLLLIDTASVSAQSHDAITGRVANGTPGAEAPEGLAVFLTIFDGDVPILEVSSITDEDGAFSFSNVPEGPSLRYVVSVVYQGAVYQITASLGQSAPVELTIYETTIDGEVLTVLDDTIMVTRGEEEFGELLVREVVRIRNSGQRTFLPSFGQEQDGMAGMTFLRFSLPFGYEDLSVTSDLLRGQVIPIDRGVGVTAPVPPGIHALVLVYTVAYDDDSLVFEPLYPFGAEVLRVLVRDDMGTAVGSDLEQMEPIAVGENTFKVFQRSDIEAGERITLGFIDLPRAPWIERVWDAIKNRWELSMVIPGVTGLLLLALLVYAWRLRPTRPDAIAPSTIAQNVQRQPAQRRWLEAIARLDEGFERGEIKREDYVVQREELKRSLLRLVAKDARHL